MSMTPPAWYLPPPDTLSGNHPELAVHPRMNFRSMHIASYYVRAPITFHLSCHVSICICLLNIYCFSPLYSPVEPAAVADYTAVEYDYYVNDPTPTVDLPGKQSHSLPQISHIFLYISCTWHCYYCYVIILFNCIAYLCRPLINFLLSYVALY